MHAAGGAQDMHATGGAQDMHAAGGAQDMRQAVLVNKLMGTDAGMVC